MSGILINFDEETKLLLKQKAKETGFSVNKLVRDFVINNLKKSTKKSNPFRNVRGVIKAADLRSDLPISKDKVSQNIDKLLYD